MFDCKFIPQKNIKVSPIPFLLNTPMIDEGNKSFKLISTISWKGLNRDVGHYTYDHYNIKKSIRINANDWKITESKIEISSPYLPSKNLPSHL